MVKLWIQKLQQNLKCRMYLKWTMPKPNIYTIWYIEWNSIFDKIGVRKYAWKCFHWYCLPEGHVNWNKGQISITWFALQTFHRRFKWDIFVSNDSPRNKFKEKCCVMSFTNPCDESDDVIPGHVKIGTCDMLSVFPCTRFILNRRLLLKP